MKNSTVILFKKIQPKMENEQWIIAILSNDEVTSDEELVSQFIEEGGVSQEEANKWVSKRMFYLNNIVKDDGTVYDPGKNQDIIH